MKAWVIAEPGQKARLSDVQDVSPGPGQALIEVAAAGLNFADLLMAQGKYQERPALPFIPGMELAGHVRALGPGTTGPAVGTAVAAYVSHGAFAEQAIIPVSQLLVLPKGMPLSQGAGFQIIYGTSHLALIHKAALQPGETLFVTGAAGGVGLTAVELGALCGARVIAQARGPEKAALARAAGAEVVIDADQPDLKQVLRDLGGVDVAYDTVGGPGFDQILRAMKPGGRMLAIGFASGDVPQVPLNQLLVRNVSVIGLWWGGYKGFAPDIMAQSLNDLLTMYSKGKISPTITQELAFEDLHDGLEALRSRKASGKIVLRVQPKE